MTFLVILACTLAAICLLRRFIKRMPGAFYACMAAFDIIYVAAAQGLLQRTIWVWSCTLMQKGLLTLALFTIVMYIGVLPKESLLARWLRPIRAELSIGACILCVAHLAAYLPAYVARALSGSMSASLAFALGVALVLIVLLLVLGITSLTAVKKHIEAGVWKRVQLLAYPFFLLVYVHLLLMLTPSAIAGGIQAQTSIVVYSVLFGTYTILRPLRAIVDRLPQTAKPDLQATGHMGEEELLNCESMH